MDSVVANARYEISVQKKSRGNLIQDSAFMIEILTGINLMRNTFLTRYFMWLMVMSCEFKKYIVSYFRQMSQSMKNHEKLELVCVLIEINLR
jgi:hypothetical protein